MLLYISKKKKTDKQVGERMHPVWVWCRRVKQHATNNKERQ